MASYQNIKKQLLPLIKGFPVIITLFIISIIIAKQVIKKINPTTSSNSIKSIESLIKEALKILNE